MSHARLDPIGYSRPTGTYYFRSGETDASARWQGDEFVILQGSRIWLRPLPSNLAYIERERDDLRQRGSIDPDGVLLDDVSLASPSRAACFAFGADVSVKGNANAWRDDDGVDPIEARKLGRGAVGDA